MLIGNRSLSYHAASKGWNRQGRIKAESQLEGLSNYSSSESLEFDDRTFIVLFVMLSSITGDDNDLVKYNWK